MANRYITILFLICTLHTFAQKKAETIVTINGQPFSKEEFESTYKKNNTNLGEGAEIKTPEEYMELFVNFKLKVMDAKRQGFDTISSFINELKGYRNELAQPYLADVQYNEEMVKNAYYRTRFERKVSHLLISTPNETDTLTAYQRIQEIRQQISNGADFNEIAAKYSEDPSAKQNRGELGWFNAFQMVYAFEDMAYKTPVGQVSIPVRTKFGYHLVLVEEERESKGQMSAAHIMKRFADPKASPVKSNESIKAQIDSIYQALQNGASFEEMAAKYSDDLYSAQKGGQIPLFTENRMIPSFAEAAYKLVNDGDISPVIKTQYGWHIIKRLKHIPVPGFDELKDQLIENIKRNPQISQYNRQKFILKLKKEYNFLLENENLKYLIENCPVDQTAKKPVPKVGIDPSKTLFSFAGKNFLISDFIKFLDKKYPENSEPAEVIPTEALVNEYIDQELISYEDNKLEEKYPEFRFLMQEYHDGILLFNISEKMIWNKAVEDTTGLMDFYQTNKVKYMGEEMFDGWVIECKDFATRAKTDEILNKENVGKDELMQIINNPDTTAIKIIEGKFKKGENPVVDFYVWGANKPENMNDQTTYIRGNKLPPAPKPLKESKGLHIADYQNFLEQKWIRELRHRYKVKLNKAVLKTIVSLK